MKYKLAGKHNQASARQPQETGKGSVTFQGGEISRYGLRDYGWMMDDGQGCLASWREGVSKGVVKRRMRPTRDEGG